MKRILIALFFLVVIQKCEKITYVYDNTKPEITEQITTETQSSSVKISWETSEACSTIFEYSSYKNVEKPDTLIFGEFREIHNIELNSLWPDVEYYCLINLYDYYDNGPVTSDTVFFRTNSNELSKCWSYIGANKLSNAENYLKNYLQSNNESVKTQFTRAWINLNKGKINQAEELMLKIMDYNPRFVPNFAGLLVVNKLKGNNQNVIKYGNDILDRNSHWNFVYADTDLNYKYIHAMMAESLLKRNNFEECQNHIDILWEIIFGETSGVQPDIPRTWEIKGNEYETYENTLISAIQIIYDNI